MKLSDFNYNLPKELIVQKPVCPRDHSKLMILNRQVQKIEHRHFYNIVNYLKKGDVLVLNNTKVFPARLIGRRKDTGGKVEVFLLQEAGRKTKDVTRPSSRVLRNQWEVLIGNRRKRIGQVIEFTKSLKGEIIKQLDESVWLVRFNKLGRQFERIIDKIGQVPTPPYIKHQIPSTKFPACHRLRLWRMAGRQTNLKSQISNLKQQYQTVYAKYKGSVAGPTAGFHFTKQLINRLRKKGAQIEYITLHVGFGTFEPVKVEDITKHKMHAEFAILDNQTAKRLNQAKKEGRRIIAVGTTSARTLETFSRKLQIPTTKLQTNLKPQTTNHKLTAQNKWINTFIYPGYQFKFVDAMITNFHLPKSTLLMLVSAFAGSKFILKAYQIAVKKKYRFYSFGDAMFIV